MREFRIAALVVVVAMLGFLNVSRQAVAYDRDKSIKANLSGYEEVPTLSSPGSGQLRGHISGDDSSIAYELSYQDLEGTPLAAHIHLGARGTNGGVAAFLCGGGGKPPCPPAGSVSGTIVAADVIGPAGQGIAPGEFEEFLKAIRAGATYANVHTSLRPGGEIRGQID
jgi:hypothetical protein